MKSGSGAASVADEDDLALALDLEQLGGLDQVAQLAVAVVARVEGRLVADLAPDLSEVSPAVVAVRDVDRIAQHLHQASITTKGLAICRLQRSFRPSRLLP